MNELEIYIPADAISPKTLEIWLKLPLEIRNDPLMKAFQEYYRDHHNEQIDNDGQINEIEANYLCQHTSIDTNCESVYVASISQLKYNWITSFITCQIVCIFKRAGELDVENDIINLQSESAIRKNFISLKNKIACLKKCTKTISLIIFWIAFTTILIIKDERMETVKLTFVPPNQTKFNFIFDDLNKNEIQIILYGPFLNERDTTKSTFWLDLWIDAVTFHRKINDSQNLETDIKTVQRISSVWRIPLISKNIHSTSIINRQNTILELNHFKISNATYSASMKSDIDETFPLNMSYDAKPMNSILGIIFAALILTGLYILIIFEIVHRTFAAIFSSTLSLAALAILDHRPTMKEIVGWIDIETLLLLFSMMVIVAILTETGLFDNMAVLAYKITRGKIWPLITCLCLFTCILASLLDNVTTILLMTPVAIRLCEAMNIIPVPVLILMVIFSNIGGTATPIGDPPNVIIASNPHVISSGVNFATFTLHMVTGLVFVCLQTYFQFRFIYKNISTLKNPNSKDILSANQKISQWQKVDEIFSKEMKQENDIHKIIINKIKNLELDLQKKLNCTQIEEKVYQETLVELTEKYGIKDKNLLIKCGIVITFVITIFFLHTLPELQRISLGWTALLGVILLLILTDRQDIEIILSKVEWTTLLFFTALFILMEALTKLGLISFIGKQTETIIMSVSESSRLAVAILLILWVCALTSAFVDNIPLATMMIKIAISLGNNPALRLPLQPLMWALSFGACLGGNGTLIGASANIVCAGIAGQHGHRISFATYFKMGFPIMLCSITIVSGYLMICHVLFQWH